jgi:hypothetical protein
VSAPSRIIKQGVCTVCLVGGGSSLLLSLASSKYEFATAVYFADCLEADVGMTYITLCLAKLYSLLITIFAESYNVFDKQGGRQILIKMGLECVVSEMHSKCLNYFLQRMVH